MSAIYGGSSSVDTYNHETAVMRDRETFTAGAVWTCGGYHPSGVDGEAKRRFPINRPRIVHAIDCDGDKVAFKMENGVVWEDTSPLLTGRWAPTFSVREVIAIKDLFANPVESV